MISFLVNYIVLCSNDEIAQEFEVFGKIIEIKRPINLGKHVPSKFAFIKYESSEDGYRVIEEMDYRLVWEKRIRVSDGNKQQSFFTQDTGQH